MRNIILGYDGSEAARRALDRVAELANGGSVTVVAAVHVMPQFGRAPSQIDPDEIDERRRELHEAKAALEAKGIEAHAVEAHGDPAEAIIEAAEKGADLVVVGTRGANLASRVLLGSVSTKVVHEAPCDVLVVR